ncbi:hypothetical protein NKR23_g9761 [Pleurostoma richardsiae]|uniref:Uncharacterized protein n=1 Tax=Pleurostoma richardsiae TaxID=41990 RepID=A0AA38RBZ1_9PEZI|nr:hypothetical protein NKR23_g9761 [Pleurostoma richardsiae]
MDPNKHLTQPGPVPVVLPAQQPSAAYQVLDLVLKVIATGALVGILVVLALAMTKLNKIHNDLDDGVSRLYYLSQISEYIYTISNIIANGRIEVEAIS